MKTEIIRVGNSLTVEIPEELAAQVNLAPGDAVEWVAGGPGSLSLVKEPGEPPKQRRRRMTLEQLLEEIPENAEMEKIDWGPDRGAEVC